MTKSLATRPLGLLVTLWLASGIAGAATTQTNLPPKLFAVPNNAPTLTPGTELEGTSYSADGTPAELPEAGRYLLWVVDEAFALELSLDGENREALGAQFPDWTFVFSEGPADALRWIDLQAAVLDEDNRVESGLILVAAEETLDASLRQALAAVSGP